MTVWAIALCFNQLEIIERSLRRLRITRRHRSKLVLVDQHYPAELQRRTPTAYCVRDLAERFNAQLLDFGRNLGLHEGFNSAMRAVGVGPEDFVIGYDPDTNPVTPGWDEAAIKVLSARPDIAWVSLGNEFSEREMQERGSDHDAVGDIRIQRTHKAVMNSVCVWRASWLLEVGGLTEPNEFYGGLECAMFAKLGARKWVFLPDFREERTTAAQDSPDPEYRDYKQAHAHQGWKGDFAAWLCRDGR